MAKASKSWLKEFVENMIAEYCSGASRRDSVAEEILEAVLKIDANTASSWIAYQPEMPSEIKKFKKVR